MKKILRSLSRWNWQRSLSRWNWRFRSWFRLRTQSFQYCFWFLGRQFWRLRSWLFSRRLRPLLFGLPALLLGVAVVTLLVLSFVQPTLAVENRYLNQGKSFIRSGKWDQALTCYDHLAHAGAAHPEYLYGLAVTLYAKGQHERAQAIMNQLAQPDTNGYPRPTSGRPAASSARPATWPRHVTERRLTCSGPSMGNWRTPMRPMPCWAKSTWQKISWTRQSHT